MKYFKFGEKNITYYNKYSRGKIIIIILFRTTIYTTIRQ